MSVCLQLHHPYYTNLQWPDNDLKFKFCITEVCFDNSTDKYQEMNAQLSCVRMKYIQMYKCNKVYCKFSGQRFMFTT